MAEYGGPAQTAGTQYFTTDYLGSTRMILNGTGGCVERLDYAPFGGQISRSGQDCYGGASSEKPLFTGQMRDGESTAGTDTGQDYFNARYFWANTARFTSPDAPFADQHPADGQSWNMYAYVRNNPLRYVDFMVRECVDGVSVNMENDEDNGKFCFVTDATSTPITTTQDTTSSATEDEQVSVDHNIMALLPTRDVPIYGLMGEGSLVLAVAGRQATERLDCLGVPVEFGAGYALFRGGQPVPGSKPFVTPGSSLGTSPISEALRGLNVNLPVPVPTPVGGPGTGVPFRFAGTRSLGATLGRYAPFAGIAGMGLSVAHAGYCVTQ